MRAGFESGIVEGGGRGWMGERVLVKMEDGRWDGGEWCWDE